MNPYALLTLHRPANVDHRGSLLDIIQGLQELAESTEIIFPVHPRTRQRIHEHGLAGYFHSQSDADKSIREKVFA